MNRRTRSLCRVTLLICLAVSPRLSSGQDGAAAERPPLPDAVLAYLKRMGPKVRFRGEVVVIPKDLREALEREFYLHRFHVVRMERSRDISWAESELIVVTDAKSGEVVSSVWELGVGGTPESFKELLTPYPEIHDWRVTMYHVKLLGELLVYPDRDYEKTMGGRVGSLRHDPAGTTIEAELIKGYRPHRLLRVRIEEKNGRRRFGRLSIVDAETCKET
jgi:hypothetical protein